ncbi:MAG: M28 family peptidase [Sphingobacteriales bacterium]|nr:MAG: M28 family peptidase [Sphingobacteriales bacterium]
MSNNSLLKQLSLLIILTTFMVQGAFAQKTSALPKSHGKKTAPVFAKTITTDDLKKHLTILASDEYAGRGNGQAGVEMAAKYLAEQFAAIGIPPLNGTYFQEFPLQRQAWDSPSVSIHGKVYHFKKDFYCFPRSNKTLIENFSEIVFLGYGIEDTRYNNYLQPDSTEVNVKDKIVVVMHGEPKTSDNKFLLTNSLVASEWTTNWRKKLETATKKGVKALLIVVDDVEKNVEQLKHFINSDSFELKTSGNTQASSNSLYISREMAEALLNMRLNDLENKLQNHPFYLNVSTDLSLSITKKGEELFGKNVLGFIEGTDLKNEVIVLTAHYDHLGIEDGEIYNGADDDGSGTVALIEIAEAFWRAKQAGRGPRRSILIMPVAAEEKGLLGSQFYTDFSPIFPLSNTVANLNIDMIGRIDPEHLTGDYVYIIGSDKLSTELHNINEAANKSYTKLDLDYRYNVPNDPNRFYYRSDHYNFAKNKIPVIFYFNGTHADYHKPSDTLEKINFNALHKRTLLVFYTAWQLANQTPRIVVDVNKP